MCRLAITVVVLLLSTAPTAAPTNSDVPLAERTIEFVHTHTGESLAVVYKRDGEFVAESLRRLDEFLRDHRTGEVQSIDPDLFDILWEIRAEVGGDEPFHLVSAYRTAETNETLRKAGRNVARNSQHVQGKAIDFRLPGVGTARLRDAALALGRGGVGYYEGSDFVHVDTGRVRRW